MNVTEIKSSLKPWKLTPTKGVLFSNPAYISSPVVRPSPIKVVPGKKESMRRRSGAGDPLASSLSKVTFKRERASLKPEREHRPHRKAVFTRHLEMAPQNTSVLTMQDVLKEKSPISGRRRLQPLETNNVSTKDNVGEVQCRVPHSQPKPTPIVKIGPVKPADRAPVESDTDKENTPLPKCAPAAVKDYFLRSMSNGHALHRNLSRKNSGTHNPLLYCYCSNNI